MELKHQYRSDVDGLRAVAILSVIVFHAFPSKLPSGFVGVDVFFVISGFLITKLILEQLHLRTFSLVGFYARRVRRIFPALFVTLFFSIIFSIYYMTYDEWTAIGKHIAGGAGFVSNFILWNEIGYFDKGALTKPFRNLWSLAVEEQFYLFWPFLLIVFNRNSMSLLRGFVLIGVISFLLNLALVQSQYGEAAFYFPFGRLWEFVLYIVEAPHISNMNESVKTK